MEINKKKEEYDIIISINVHEKPEYLKEQLSNINTYLKLRYKIILSCNDFMYNNIIINEDLVVNPEIINKKRFHGSLTKGIYSNMVYAITNFSFKYFLIMSSREFFYRELNKIEDIEKTKLNKLNDYNKVSIWDGKNGISFKETKLFKYIINNKLYFARCGHEVLTFNYDSCLYINQFLEKESEIREDIFNYNHCVEEFSLQTICCNYSDFYNIGNGTSTMDVEKASKYRFTHKKIR